jgi:ABC-2 type transport system ATP-binding protein
MLKISGINVFIGKKRIIKDVSFDVEKGAVVGLIGSNGAGKTTIMKTILGLTKFTGNVQVEGQAVSENKHGALGRVGALIEHPAIYPFLTGYQNLNLYAKEETDLREIVSMLEMDSYIDEKSKGYSLGMKQKLGIAIALLNHPELVILDEPMNGLDIDATILVRNLIKKYANQGTSFLISSHILSELEKVITDVVFISEGKMILHNSIEEFNQVDASQYKVRTKDMKKSIAKLTENGVAHSVSEGYIHVSDEVLDQTQDVLFQNGMHLLELVPEEISFEDKVVSLLDQKRGNNDEK